jgi:hypothetical protein
LKHNQASALLNLAGPFAYPTQCAILLATQHPRGKNVFN